jgi:hypothetical protein
MKNSRNVPLVAVRFVIVPKVPAVNCQESNSGDEVVISLVKSGGISRVILPLSDPLKQVYGYGTCVSQ